MAAQARGSSADIPRGPRADIPTGPRADRHIQSLAIQRQICRELSRLIPSSFRSTPGYSRVSLWHTTIKYLDQLTGRKTATAFDTDPFNIFTFSSKNRACRDILARKLPPKYHVGWGRMSTLIPQWCVRYIRELVAEKSEQKFAKDAVNNVVDKHPSAEVKPVDEDGVLDLIAFLKDLISTEEEDPGKLIALGERKTGEWVKAMDVIRNFVTIGDTDLDSLLLALAGLRGDFEEEVRDGRKLNTKGLLRLAKKVNKRADKVHEAMEKLKAWFGVGLENGED